MALRKNKPEIKRPSSFAAWVRYMSLYMKCKVGIAADMEMNERLVNHKLAKRVLIIIISFIALTASAQVDSNGEEALFFHSIGQTNYYPKALQIAVKLKRHGVYYHFLMKQAHYTFSQQWYSKAYAYHLYSLNKYSQEYLHYAKAHDVFMINHSRLMFGIKPKF